MRSRPVIVQHCCGPDKPGGPMSGLRLLLASPLAEKYEFHTCYQTRPASGLNLPLALEMARQIRTHRPDILHVRGLQNEGLHGLLAGKLAGCRRIVVSVHGFAGDATISSSVRRFLFNHIIEPFTLHSATVVYCVSERQAKRPMIKRWARGFRGVIPNAAPVFRPIVPRDIMRERLGFSPRDIVCITVTRITFDKGLGVLAQAISMSNVAGLHGVKYLVVGDGDYANTFQREVEEEIRAGRVTMAGARSDVLDLLNAADIFVFPTLHENLSNALLEAGAAGKAVIATDVGGNAEIITHHVTGLLVPPSNAESIVAAIRTLVGTPALQLSLATNLQRRIHDVFSQRRVFALLDQLYASVLSMDRPIKDSDR